MDSHREEEDFEPNVDISGATRPVWLVKVPKYLETTLESAQPSQVIGKIRIDTKDNKSPQISFNLSEDIAKSHINENKENIESVPIEHRFILSLVDRQTMAIFSHNEKTNLVSIKGNVVHRGEIQPIVSTDYLNLYKDRMKRRSEPLRRTQTLDRSVTVFKPVSNIPKLKKKESPIKRFKKDRESVRNMLFECFEKHQYYNLKDLERLTLQPPYYLKEIMKEMCLYNIKSPHQYMWELRPEFRHYINSKVKDS